MTEALSEYLGRVMKQKGLKPRDVSLRCGIAESYVRRILNGRVTNLTVETIVALAKGLEIDAVGLFVAAYGRPMEATAAVDMTLLADSVYRLIMDPELVRLVQEWVRLPLEHQQTFLQAFKLVQKKATRSHRK